LNVLAEFDPGARLVIGHRGAAARFPENTFAAFDYAVGLGVDAIEFDIRMTGDGVVVVIHDPTLGRTTNSAGPVAGQSAADVAQVDAGARFSPDGGRTFPFAGRGIGVPTLDELIERYPGIPLLIEIKVAEAAPEALRLFRRHACEDRVLIDSMDFDALKLFRGTRVSVGAARRDVDRPRRKRAGGERRGCGAAGRPRSRECARAPVARRSVEAVGRFRCRAHRLYRTR